MKKLRIFFAVFTIVVVLGTAMILMLADKNNNANDFAPKEIIDFTPDEPERVVDLDLSEHIEEVGEMNENGDSAMNDAQSEETILGDKETTVSDENPGRITLTFAGDILFDSGYSVYAAYLQRGKDINQCFSAELLEDMRSADIMMLNNEFPYSDRGSPLEGKQYTFRAQPDSVNLLKEMGVDIVSIANNHMYDFGQDAFSDTLDTLNNADVPYVGGGADISEAAKPYVFRFGDFSVAFLGATQIERNANPDTKEATDTTPGVFRCFNPDKMCEAIKAAKMENDFVVCYVHWGTESTDVLDYRQTEQAKMFSDAGADLIIGDHPHVLQGIAYFNDTPVIYSLGNYWFNSKTLDTCIVTATIDSQNGRLESFRFIPCLQSNMKTTKLEGSEKSRLINYMQTISYGVNIDSEGYITKR